MTSQAYITPSRYGRAVNAGAVFSLIWVRRVPLKLTVQTAHDPNRGAEPIYPWGLTKAGRQNSIPARNHLFFACVILHAFSKVSCRSYVIRSLIVARRDNESNPRRTTIMLDTPCVRGDIMDSLERFFYSVAENGDKHKHHGYWGRGRHSRHPRTGQLVPTFVSSIFIPPYSNPLGTTAVRQRN